MLPKFIIIHIFTFLDLKTLQNCSLVSKYFLACFRNEYLWKQKIDSGKRSAMDFYKECLDLSEALKYEINILSETYVHVPGQKIPKFLPRMPCLETLDFRECNLTEIPEFLCMPHIKTFILHKNKLNSVTPQIGNMTSLEELNLDQNNLTTLPPEITKLKKLQILHLDYNRIEIIPDLRGLQNLQWICANGNPITEFPNFLSEMPSLELIAIRSNIHTQKERLNINRKLYRLLPNLRHCIV